jgi:hypothetical protein
MAQTLANLLDCVGIPRNLLGVEEQLKECFELFWTNKLYDSEERQRFKKRVNCKCQQIGDWLEESELTIISALEVPIQFLGCFDTVGSLGVPNTGILTPLKYTPPLIRHLQFRSTNLPGSKLYLL